MVATSKRHRETRIHHPIRHTKELSKLFTKCMFHMKVKQKDENRLGEYSILETILLTILDSWTMVINKTYMCLAVVYVRYRIVLLHSSWMVVFYVFRNFNSDIRLMVIVRILISCIFIRFFLPHFTKWKFHESFIFHTFKYVLPPR